VHVFPCLKEGMTPVQCFATILKNSRVSTEFISEVLGNSSLITAKNYPAGFEQKTIKKVTDVLISFNKPKLAVA